MAGLDLRAIAGLSALDRARVERKRPIERRIPEAEVEQPFRRPPVIEAEVLVDHLVAEVEAEHEGDCLAPRRLPQDDEMCAGLPGHAFEEAAIELFEAHGGPFTGLAKEAEDLVERVRIRGMQHLGAQLDRLLAAADLLPHVMAARRFQTGEVALLVRYGELDDRSGEAHHAK